MVLGVHAPPVMITRAGKWLLALFLSLPFAALALMEWLLF